GEDGDAYRRLAEAADRHVVPRVGVVGAVAAERVERHAGRRVEVDEVAEVEVAADHAALRPEWQRRRRVAPPGGGTRQRQRDAGNHEQPSYHRPGSAGYQLSQWIIESSGFRLPGLKS